MQQAQSINKSNQPIKSLAKTIKYGEYNGCPLNRMLCVQHIYGNPLCEKPILRLTPFAYPPALFSLPFMALLLYDLKFCIPPANCLCTP